MRNIILILAGLALFGCSIGLQGCATSVSDIFNGGAGNEERSGISYITITSTPSDAEIYINDRLVGRTPSSNVPLSYKYEVWRQPYGLGHTNPYVKEGYIIRVSKKGYKDAFETIEFDYQATPFAASCFLKKKDYHFELEKE